MKRLFLGMKIIKRKRFENHYAMFERKRFRNCVKSVQEDFIKKFKEQTNLELDHCFYSRDYVNLINKLIAQRDALVKKEEPPEDDGSVEGVSSSV